MCQIGAAKEAVDRIINKPDQEDNWIHIYVATKIHNAMLGKERV